MKNNDLSMLCNSVENSIDSLMFCPQNEDMDVPLMILINIFVEKYFQINHWSDEVKLLILLDNIALQAKTLTSYQDSYGTIIKLPLVKKLS